MSEQMKGITVCGDCAYYSMKKHKCTRGCTDEGDARAKFYVDCPLPDVRPVVYGRWIEDGDNRPTSNDKVYCCSNCKGNHRFRWQFKHFCEDCGAIMLSEQEGTAQ